MDSLGTMLGTNWDLKQMNNQAPENSENSEPSDQLMIPLAIAINPKILEYVKSQAGKVGTSKTYIGGGEYTPTDGEVVKSTASLSDDAFLALLGRGPVGSAKKNKGKKKEGK